ncbi:hypothetical protein G7Y89_g15368 [Cudoniella acicularis]|uniref:Uncharacterized protein n=1 Tax=Cudoniella acicularis TaxID=354080 RepID=A0A8H4VNK1_9HELO|nr:hypothetical protein G7Y89_g15368 [Cudoniella acicularis]
MSAKDQKPTTIPNGKTPNNKSINNLPPELLYPILQTVYVQEEKSLRICRCSRPTTPYRHVQKTDLAHLVANTLVLRSVCHAFHQWAMVEVLSIFPSLSHPHGKEIEVDFSSFALLQNKLGESTASGLVTRLLKDFPGLSRNEGGRGLTIYLGDPGAVGNIKEVEAMLSAVNSTNIPSEIPLKIFTGVSFWDLDYYSREEIPTCELERLLFLQRGGKDVKSPGQVPNLIEYMISIPIDICRDIYEEDQQLYASLISKLSFADSNPPTPTPASKIHIPLSAICALSTGKKASTLSKCTALVLRDFHHDYDAITNATYSLIYSKWDLKKRATIAKAYKKSFETDTIFPRHFTASVKSRFEANKFCKWSDHVSKEGFPLLTNMKYIEFRRRGLGRNSQEGNARPIWPPLYDAAIQKFSPLFGAKLETVVFIGKDLPPGEILEGLLGLKETLGTFICRSETGRSSWENPLDYPATKDPFCKILRQFKNLRILDVEAPVCEEVFADDEGDLGKGKVLPIQRSWILRTLSRPRLETDTCCCNHSTTPTNQFQHPHPFPNRDLNLKSLSPRDKLVISCQAWRDRHQEKTQETLADWDVEIHISNCCDRAAGMVIMPLKRPCMQRKMWYKGHGEVVHVYQEYSDPRLL